MLILCYVVFVDFEAGLCQCEFFVRKEPEIWSCGGSWPDEETGYAYGDRHARRDDEHPPVLDQL